jgi:thiamine-monophosphate kinase
MDEFNLIDYFFKQHALTRPEVVFGIGDDCACLRVPSGQDLLISTDTLVADVHFLSNWDPYDIAYKAVMVNISDCAAMAATPFALTLALTLPKVEQAWLTRFSEGLFQALNAHQIALIGGDTTRGPLSLTITIHGLAPFNQAIRRNGAHAGDAIYVTGPLGLAAFGVKHLLNPTIASEQRACVQKALHHPVPRTDFILILREFATSAIDISDGLLADLNHICEASGLGAHLDLQHIPVHPFITPLSSQDQPLEFALRGGDDYELCFTVPKQSEPAFLEKIKSTNLSCYKIGFMNDTFTGLRGLNLESQYVELSPKGYTHF